MEVLVSNNQDYTATNPTRGYLHFISTNPTYQRVSTFYQQQPNLPEGIYLLLAPSKPTRGYPPLIRTHKTYQSTNRPTRGYLPLISTKPPCQRYLLFFSTNPTYLRASTFELPQPNLLTSPNVFLLKQIPSLDIELAKQIPSLDIELTKQIPSLDIELARQILSLDIELTKQIPLLDIKLAKQIDTLTDYKLVYDLQVLDQGIQFRIRPGETYRVGTENHSQSDLIVSESKITQ